MLRSFDLSIYEKEVNQLLNDPMLRLIRMDISSTEESGITMAHLEFRKCDERVERKFDRHLRLFSLYGRNQELDDILSDPKYRVVKKNIFTSEDGTVVVLDYQTRKVAN